MEEGTRTTQPPAKCPRGTPCSAWLSPRPVPEGVLERLLLAEYWSCPPAKSLLELGENRARDCPCAHMPIQGSWGKKGQARPLPEPPAPCLPPIGSQRASFLSSFLPLPNFRPYRLSIGAMKLEVGWPLPQHTTGPRQMHLCVQEPLQQAQVT